MGIEDVYTVILFSILILSVVFAIRAQMRSLEDKVKSTEHLTLLEITRMEKLEERFDTQYNKYTECVADLSALKAQLLYTIDSVDKNIKPARIEILGIWPEYDNITYRKLDQVSEIEALSKTNFAFTKLDTANATREAIVNELSINNAINVLQIGAHGDDTVIVLSPSVDGDSFDLVTHDWFSKVLKQYDIKLVLLFVCTSNKLADMLYRNDVNCVLGFREDVRDDQVIKFLKNFYKFLSSRKSVSESTRLALLSFDNEISSSIVLRGDYTFDN